MRAMTRLVEMPLHMDTATATTEARTAEAPLTPHIHGMALVEMGSMSRIPMGKHEPRSSERGAVMATTIAQRTGNS